MAVGIGADEHDRVRAAASSRAVARSRSVPSSRIVVGFESSSPSCGASAASRPPGRRCVRVLDAVAERRGSRRGSRRRARAAKHENADARPSGAPAATGAVAGPRARGSCRPAPLPRFGRGSVGTLPCARPPAVDAVRLFSGAMRRGYGSRRPVTTSARHRRRRRRHEDPRRRRSSATGTVARAARGADADRVQEASSRASREAVERAARRRRGRGRLRRSRRRIDQREGTRVVSVQHPARRTSRSGERDERALRPAGRGRQRRERRRARRVDARRRPRDAAHGHADARHRRRRRCSSSTGGSTAVAVRAELGHIVRRARRPSVPGHLHGPRPPRGSPRAAPPTELARGAAGARRRTPSCSSRRATEGDRRRSRRSRRSGRRLGAGDRLARQHLRPGGRSSSAAASAIAAATSCSSRRSRRCAGRRCRPARDRVRIVAAELGADAGLIGAGLLAFEALAQDELVPLAVCATPIGNLEDVTLRVLARAARGRPRALRGHAADARRCSTRHGITARLLSYHEHNEAQRTAELLPRLAAGERIALVSDAGLPGVSDPGARLVAAALEAGVPVTVLPGPSAVETALVASGLVGERYQFSATCREARRRSARSGPSSRRWPHRRRRVRVAAAAAGDAAVARGGAARRGRSRSAAS